MQLLMTSPVSNRIESLTISQIGKTGVVSSTSDGTDQGFH